MTPMIDVVFLLIVFFLVSSHLARQETAPEVELPEALTATYPQDTPPRRVVVNVLPEGAEVVWAVAGERVGLERLKAILAAESRQEGGPCEVRIRTDRRVPYRVIEPILLACAELGIKDVTFAVIGPR